MINYSRRIFLKVAAMMAISLSPLFRMARATSRKNIGNDGKNNPPQSLGVDAAGDSHVYYVIKQENRILKMRL